MLGEDAKGKYPFVGWAGSSACLIKDLVDKTVASNHVADCMALA